MACAAMRPSRPVTSVGFGRLLPTRQAEKAKINRADLLLCELGDVAVHLVAVELRQRGRRETHQSRVSLALVLLLACLGQQKSQLEGNKQLLDSHWVVLQPAVVGDGASVVELALRQFFPSSRAARVFENGLNRKVVNGRREDDFLLGRHVNHQVCVRLGLGGLKRAEGHHVGRQGIAGKAGGLELEGCQAVGHRELRSHRRRQLRGQVAPSINFGYAEVQVVRVILGQQDAQTHLLHLRVGHVRLREELLVQALRRVTLCQRHCCAGVMAVRTSWAAPQLD